MADEADDTREYEVVVNHEEQYSIWLAGREIPGGWRAAGNAGPKPSALLTSMRHGLTCAR